jgi:hypothetical protein
VIIKTDLSTLRQEAQFGWHKAHVFELSDEGRDFQKHTATSSPYFLISPLPIRATKWECLSNSE